MPNNQLSDIYAVGKDFIPHIEEAALQYIRRRFIMPNLVTVMGDMSGWNARKVSEYLPTAMADVLTEATDIPSRNLIRARRQTVEPQEIGAMHPITNRRASTDLENIIADAIADLGYSVGRKVEYDLVNVGVKTFGAIGNRLDFAANNFSVAYPIQAEYEIGKARGTDIESSLLYCVVHPFQARDIMTTATQFTGADAGAALKYRDEIIRAWRLPGFNNVIMSVSDSVPRLVTQRIAVYGTVGTFRLTVADKTTAAITVSGTTGTMQTNIKSALDALNVGVWTLTGASNLLINAVSTVAYVADHELRVAIDPATPTLVGQKSAYDLVTSLSGAPLDLAGNQIGVAVAEVSATADALFFARPALLLDIREPFTAFFDPTLNQGRTAQYALHGTYAADYWQPDKGMLIKTKANSAKVVV